MDYQAVFFKREHGGAPDDWADEQIRRAAHTQPPADPPLINAPQTGEIHDIKLSGIPCQVWVDDLAATRLITLSFFSSQFHKRIRCQEEYSYLRDGGMGFAKAFRHLCETIQPEVAATILYPIDDLDEYLDNLEEHVINSNIEKLLSYRYGLLYLSDSYAENLDALLPLGSRDELPCSTGRLLFAGTAPPLYKRWF